jgi:hypothetical protein
VTRFSDDVTLIDEAGHPALLSMQYLAYQGRDRDLLSTPGSAPSR